MAFDYKKEYKEFYMPKGTPSMKLSLDNSDSVETVVLLRRKNIDDHLEFTWTDEEFGKKKGTLS